MVALNAMKNYEDIKNTIEENKVHFWEMIKKFQDFIKEWPKEEQLKKLGIELRNVPREVAELLYGQAKEIVKEHWSIQKASESYKDTLRDFVLQEAVPRVRKNIKIPE
jgi:hypothetical protein